MVLIDGPPGSGKTTVVSAISHLVGPRQGTGRFFELPASSVGTETDLRHAVFNNPDHSTLERAIHLWSWALLAAETRAALPPGITTLFLERSPYSAYAVASPLVPRSVNSALLGLAAARMTEHVVVLLHCPERVCRRRLAARAPTAGWHPTGEGERYRRALVGAYARPNDLPGRRYVVDATAPVDSVVSQVMVLADEGGP
jgi:thymidylate kinase